MDSDDDGVMVLFTTAMHWMLNMNTYYTAILMMNTLDTVQVRNTRPFSGLEMVQDILSHNGRCYDIYRMGVDHFMSLCQKISTLGILKGEIAVEEQLAMFLHIVGHGTTMRQVEEIYQHSTWTVHNCFKNVLSCILRLKPECIKMPGADTPPHARVTETPFKDAIGALDGSHVPAYVDTREIEGDEMKKRKVETYRNRKGWLSQNVLAAVDFDLNFVYVLAGFEGSAHDSKVLSKALDRSFVVPHGRYYLTDSGYANRKNFICPYKGEMYHLAQFKTWRESNDYRSADEMYNHQHALLRNVVEKAFGIWKGRFKILKVDRPYKYMRQCEIVVACCILHNYLRQLNEDSDSAEQRFINQRVRQTNLEQPTTEISIEQTDGIDLDDIRAGKLLRDSIREALWQQRGLPTPTDTDE